jgi:hypothetical protein
MRMIAGALTVTTRHTCHLLGEITLIIGVTIRHHRGPMVLIPIMAGTRGALHNTMDLLALLKETQEAGRLFKVLGTLITETGTSSLPLGRQ